MAITTTHNPSPDAYGERWTETVEGATPNSIEVSINAKGAAQVTVKLYYASPDEAEETINARLYGILNEVRSALSLHSIPLAGKERHE